MNISKKDFSAYYKNHTLIQTAEYFNLSQSKVYSLIKLFNIQKGKGHNTNNNFLWYTNGKTNLKVYKDTYIPSDFYKGRTFKKEWANKISKALTGKKQPKEVIEKRRLKSIGNKSHTNQICVSKNQKVFYIKKEDLNLYLDKGYIKGNCKTKGLKRSDEFKNNLSTYYHNNPELKKEYVKKGNNTKIKNKSFNTSKPEINFYNFLLKIYNKNDIKRQYQEERYPFMCDFYIESEDLFIELNLHWTHGKHPYNEELDKETLNTWLEKAKTSKFYEQAIYVWTNLDKQKEAYITKNKLNLIRFYSEEDILKWQNKIFQN